MLEDIVLGAVMVGGAVATGIYVLLVEKESVIPTHITTHIGIARACNNPSLIKRLRAKREFGIPVLRPVVYDKHYWGKFGSYGRSQKEYRQILLKEN